MAVPLKQKKGGSYNYEPHKIICYQVNLQHSRAATANLIQMISTDNIGMVLIQEPYLYHNKLAGITKGYRTFAYGEGKCRAAIIIQDNTIDALLITQLSYSDSSPGNKQRDIKLLRCQHIFQHRGTRSQHQNAGQDIGLRQRKTTIISNGQQLPVNDVARHFD